MSIFLIQKKLLCSNEFELTDHSLKMKTIQRFSNSIEIEFKFEDLTHDYFKVKKPKIVFFYIGVVALLGVIITTCSHFLDKKGSQLTDVLFYAIPMLISIVLFLTTYEDNFNLKLSDGRVITFFNNLPTANDLNNFYEQFKQVQRTYLLNTYATPNAYLTTEQVSNNLLWLRNREIINADELNEFRQRLLPNPKPYSAIGFRSNNN